jgi:hypothetical protein
MTRKLLALLALVATICGAHAAQAVPAQSLGEASKAAVIAPGERLEFTIAPNGGAVVAARGQASAAEAAGTPRLDNRSEALIQAPVVSAPPTPGRIVVSLFGGAGGFRLKVVNGYGFPVAYRAFLVFERDGQRSYRPTSVCPVRPGQVGVESWGDPIVGIAVADFHEVDADNMACSDGSLLTVSPSQAPSDRYACVGGETPGRLSPLTISLVVDGGGDVQSEDATWLLSAGDFANKPGIFLDFGMLGREVMPTPAGLRVFAMVGLQPPPKPTTADIVVRLNGVEKARRPWQMYAKALSSPSPPPSGDTPVSFYGVIPFVPRNGVADAGLKDLLSAVGQPKAVIEAQIVGDDGSVLADASYAVDQPPLRTQAAVDAVLDQALALAKTPAQCRKLSK